jgi:hypothetical protein
MLGLTDKPITATMPIIKNYQQIREALILLKADSIQE